MRPILGSGVGNVGRKRPSGRGERNAADLMEQRRGGGTERKWPTARVKKGIEKFRESLPC